MAAAVMLSGCACHHAKKTPESAVQGLADLNKIHQQITELTESIDKIDQPVDETTAERRKRLGLEPK